MSKQVSAVVLFIIAIFIIGGCVSTGPQVSKEMTEELIKGQTTRAEVIQKHGQPTSQMTFPTKQAFEDFLYQRTGKKAVLASPEGKYDFYLYQNYSIALPAPGIVPIRTRTTKQLKVLFCNDVVIDTAFAEDSKTGF